MSETDDQADIVAPAAGEAPPRPELEPVEARVLGCLIEKALTTPDYYPLTLKALTAACNQKSNRDPVMALAEDEVAEALSGLRYRHRLVWYVDQAGSRVPKYRHAVPDRFNFGPRELAVMCELMLRGPQTQGELRTHAARMAPLETAADVKETLDALMDWAGTALVVQLPPGPGRREPRFAHLLCGTEGLPAAAASGGGGGGGGGEAFPPPPPGPSREERLRALEQAVEGLGRTVEALQEQFTAFRRQFE
jgi:hypothetical protein